MNVSKIRFLCLFWSQVLSFFGAASCFSINCLASAGMKSEEKEVSSVCVYSTRFKASECFVTSIDATNILNESRHSRWEYHILLPIKVQAKEDIALPDDKVLKSGKRITIACHLNDYKDLSHCIGKDYIKLPKGFEPLQHHTVILHLVQALKSEIKESTDIKTLIEILNEIKLAENWVQEQFKPIDESEQLKS